MALDTKFTKILDPLDLGGTQSAERTIESAKSNAELLRRFSDVSQANLQPFLDVGTRALPGLEAGATPGGFFGDIEALRPFAESIADPIAERGIEELTTRLASQGQFRSGGAVTGAADIREQADIAALLELQSLLTGRRQQITGTGAGTGSELAGLGHRAGEQLAGIQSQGIFGAAQARAAGQQNLLALGGLGAEFSRGRGGGVPINQNLANSQNIITPAGR